MYLIGLPNTEAAWERMARAASAADMTIHEWISFLTGIRVILIPLAESIIVDPARQLPAPSPVSL